MARTRAAQSGFTLLEAIVALVIFSMGALALYGWLGANLTTLQRVAAGRDRVALASAALDSIRRVNPMETPTGRRRLGDVEVRWDAKLVEPVRESVTQVGIRNLFTVGLYSMDVRVSHSGREIDRFEVRQLGYRQVRQMEIE